jgi:hypothetical protein
MSAVTSRSVMRRGGDDFMVLSREVSLLDISTLLGRKKV